jgi:hypothetical protein
MSATIATDTAPAGSVGAEAIADLRTKLGDRLITSQDEAYDGARRVWNGMIDRKPAAIALCRGVADVIDCVRWAVDHDVLLAVRGGGHNVAGFGTCDGGLVVDLSPMNGVRVDLQRGTVRAGGGATWGDLDRETQAFGFAVPGGIVSTTGIAGLMLGGGQGWLRRTYGMACDSLVSADVVTADGRLLVASETENPDLFWALRGGGGNFGVVTSFEYRLHPLGPMVALTGPVYSPDESDLVMETFRTFFLNAPDELNGGAVWWTIPAVPGFPVALHGQDVLILPGMYAGPPTAGEKLLQPLREIAEPLLDLSATLPYVALQQLFDPFFPAYELRHYWKALYLADLQPEVIAEIKDWAGSRPSPMSMIVVNAVGGALGRVDAGETAIGARQAPFLLEILATWKEPGETEANVSWAREFFATMERFSTGRTNLNFPGVETDARFVRAAFGDNYDRLLSAKRTYDPKNVFRLNQNIDPGDSLS